MNWAKDWQLELRLWKKYLNHRRWPCRELWERWLVVEAISVAGCRCSDMFRGLFSPRSPLLAALSVSAYHRDWRDMWSLNFTVEKSGSGIHAALRSSGQKTITHGMTNPYTVWAHIRWPTPGVDFNVPHCTQTAAKTVQTSQGKSDN